MTGEAEGAAATTSASAPATLWDEMTRKVVELVEKSPSPEKHCARSAIRHVEKAWAITGRDRSRPRRLSMD
jgi:hypothetical protein